jgi:very-short-patch-repair endonuclease
MAAVLACGPCAALSHHKAGALWGLRPSSSPKIDVTVPNTNGRRRAGVRIHRSRALGADEVTVEDGIPATTPERTILDLAATLSVAHLEKVLDRMEILELAEYRTVAQLARTRTGHRGAPKLLHTLNAYVAGEQPTRSDLEVLFRQICHDHGLPQPRVNQRVAGKEVDFLFTDHRLIVEADSWRYHKTRRSFESDRARDVVTAQAGCRTVRFTDGQLANDPASVATALWTLLGCAARSSASSPRPSR